MAISDSRRAANLKWDKEHMMTLGCKVKKEEAIKFKEYAAKKNKTTNTVLKEYVLKCIDETMERDGNKGGKADDNVSG